MDGKGGGKVAREGWMRRPAVADALRISRTGVRRLEGELLHPARGDDGVWYFDPREVEAARAQVEPTRTVGPVREVAAPDRTAEGELAARLFPMFAGGVSFDDAIAATRARPETVRALYWQWRQGYRRPPSETPASSDDGDDDDESADDPETEERAFAAWEEEVRAIEREQARIDKHGRRRLR
jgi:hypothetical protein